MALLVRVPQIDYNPACSPQRIDNTHLSWIFVRCLVGLMTKAFMMKLDEIQPSQLYICSEKLDEVMRTIDSKRPDEIEPIPIKRLGGRIIFVDGHTRAFAAFLRGFPRIPVYWEDEELDWDAYAICVEWCTNEGIRTIVDLKNKVVPEKDYEILWYQRCEEMQRDLAKRKVKNRE